MIRHVATIKLREGASDEDVEAMTRGFYALELEGVNHRAAGRCLDHLPGDSDYALVIDFVDEEAFRRYHEDPDHQRLREGVAARTIESARAAQYVV